MVSRTNYDFKGWKCPNGRIADKKSDKTIGQPVYIGDTVIGNSFYIAQWKPKKHTVTFHGNGGIPNEMTRKYDHGQKLGYLPTLDEMAPGATAMDGWFDSATDGSQVIENTPVTDNRELWAHWTIPDPQYCIVKFYKHDGTEWIQQRRSVLKGSLLGDLPDPYARTGYDFSGWYMQPHGGIKATETKRVNNDLNLYAQWKGITCIITWNPNYPGAQNIVWKREYDSTLVTLPVVNRLGYTQNGWWTDEGDEITSDIEVEGNADYYAHWTRLEYDIFYNLNGGNWPTGQEPTNKYTVDDLVNLLTPEYVGRQFAGWTGSNGNTPQTEVSIPEGSTGNKSYKANWKTGTYTVEFNANGGTGTMADQTFTYDVYQKLRNNEFSDSIVVDFDGNNGDPTESSLTSYREFLGWATSASGNKVYNNQ